MKDFEIIRSLLGETITEEDLRYVDCYVESKLGLFIPSAGFCQYAISPQHTHPAYMFVICFFEDDDFLKPEITVKENHYLAAVMSPDIPHQESEDHFHHYYCVMIDKDYFNSQFLLYNDTIPTFEWTQFLICHDILKTLNTFAFEYNKGMSNADITLSAQATIITHWLIRSILGEDYDMRSISTNYSIARAQHYMEQHYGENITVAQLAQLGNTSVSTFNRCFKKEMHMSPKEYLIEHRITVAKKLLCRKELTITEISLRCGFSSSAHFSACFHRLTGQSPSQYRNVYQGNEQ